jgi:hypothetical protein
LRTLNCGSYVSCLILSVSKFPRSLSGYSSCSSLSSLKVVAEYIVVDGSLLMKDQSLKIFLIGICWFHNFLIISELCVT